MTSMVFWFGVGLLVGWNLLPQPSFVKDSVSWIVNKVKSVFKG